jgi:tRNA1(Val) A37 N6-methylase TrmN6
MTKNLNPDSHLSINPLLGFDLKIIQHANMFNYSLDSTLLADFVTVPKRTQSILDLGTGFAPIPLMLSQKTSLPITGIELQDDVYAIAIKNVELNKLESQITILHDDIKHLKTQFSRESFDIITSNPPFFKVTENANVNQSTYKMVARHEVALTLPTLFDVTSFLLKDKGLFYLDHRPERLDEIVILAKHYNLTIKRLRLVYPRIEKEASMVLIEFMKHGKNSMRILPQLIVHDDTGYTNEIKRIFRYESK